MLQLKEELEWHSWVGGFSVCCWCCTKCVCLGSVHVEDSIAFAAKRGGELRLERAPFVKIINLIEARLEIHEVSGTGK